MPFEECCNGSPRKYLKSPLHRNSFIHFKKEHPYNPKYANHLKHPSPWNLPRSKPRVTSMSWPRLLLTCKFLLRCCKIFRSTKSKKKTETLWSHSGSSPQECTTSAAAAVCTRELPSSIPTALSYHCAANTLIGKACCCTHTFDAARSGGKLQKTE